MRSDSTARVMEMLRGYRLTQMLHVLVKLGISDRLDQYPQSAPQLAAAVGADASAVYRLLRALASEGICVQQSDGSFSLTPDGRTLCSSADGPCYHAARLYGEAFWWNAWGGLVEAVRTGRSAFEQSHGMGLFDFLDTHPPACDLFTAGMRSMTSERAVAIADALDCVEVRQIIDVGGGHGALAAAIAVRHPHAAVSVFDLPSVIERHHTSAQGHCVLPRSAFMTGDFFVSVPPGADLYVLKDIVHDWDDERAAAILRNVRSAMAPGARAVIVERIMPITCERSINTLVDISMLVLTGGRERTEGEYRALLRTSGLNVRRIISVDEETSILEASGE